MIVGFLTIFAFSWFPWSTDNAPVEEEPSIQTDEPIPQTIPPSPLLFPDPLPLNIDPSIQGLNMIYASSCGGCHSSTFKEWSVSPHRLGYQSKALRTAIQEQGNSTICTQCHLPMVQQHQLLSTSYIEGDFSRPVMDEHSNFDLNLQSESVGCIACHGRDGVIVGGITSEKPHTTRASDELYRSDACEQCHQYTLPGEEVPSYNTFQEWKESAYANAGIQCQDCHMRDSTIVGNGVVNHTFNLPIQQGVTITTDLATTILQRNEAIEFSITLHNTGVGHAWPSSSPFADKNIVIQIVGSKDDMLISAIKHPIGQHRSPESMSTSINPGQSQSFQQSVTISRKHKAQMARLIISFQKNDILEELSSILIEVR